MTEPSGARFLTADSVDELLEVAVAQAGARLVRATLRSVHHRAGRSLSHVFAALIEAGGAEHEVLLVAHADSRELPDGAFVLEREGGRVAVWRFPVDPFLPGLPSAVDPARVRELLDGLGAPAGQVTLHTRAYRPSRRAVVEVTIQTDELVGRILYLKVLAGARASELADLHRQLLPGVPVPKVVGVSPRQGIVALEALEGRTLREALVTGEPLPDVAEIVELSRRFAASGLHSRRDPIAFADPARHVALLQRLAPDRADEVTRVAQAAAALDGPRVPVHGDLHDGQLLLQDAAITGVLDVDGAGAGLVAHDAGNLIAHVQVVGELWGAAAARCERFAAELAVAYSREVGGAPLAAATAGAWLGLATGPHRAQDPDREEATRHRIDRAVASLRGDASG